MNATAQTTADLEITTTARRVTYETTHDGDGSLIWHAFAGFLSVTADSLDEAREAINGMLAQYYGCDYHSVSYVEFENWRAKPRAIETFDRE